MRLRDLKGLGPESERCLMEVGIETAEDLAAIGAIEAFFMLQNECSTRPSLNFLYALVGALENRHWTEIARSERSRLIIELGAHQELEEFLKQQTQHGHREQ